MAEMNENAEKMNFHAEENREEMKSSAKNVTLTPYDELLLGANSMEIVQKIQIDKLIHFQNHPFRIKDDEEMEKLVQSIAEKGVVVPIIARSIDDEYYEIISGHRRRYACMKLGIDTMPVIIRKLNDDEAVIAMVDSNIQREHILPSERGFSYKMKLEAIKHQGQRKDLTCSQVGNKLNNQESYLEPEEQINLHKFMGKLNIIPSLEQASKLKKYSQDKKLNDGVIEVILTQETEKNSNNITLKKKDLKQYFPKFYSKKDMENVIFELLKQWQQQQSVTEKEE